MDLSAYVKKLSAPCALVAWFAWPLSAQAAVTEIGPGDDVRAAINALNPGDELVLRGGTYTFTARFGVNVIGTADQPIVVRAKDGEQPVFVRENAAQNLIDIDHAEHFTLRGIEWRGGSHGIRIHHARFLTIEDCEVHETDDVAISANSTGPYEALYIRRNHLHHTNHTGEGMYLGCNSDACRIFDSIIEGNYIHHTNGPSVSQGDGIELKEGSYNNIIRDNVIHDTNYPCILAYSTAGNGGPNIIERNVMWNCGDHAIQTAADAVIRNNIILGSQQHGIALQPHQAGAPSNLVVVHNTILHATNSAIRASGVTGSVLIANNAVYAQAGAGISVAGNLSGVVVVGNVGVGSGTLAAGDLLQDFVSASYTGAPPMDLFPKAGSALIAAGVTDHVTADDFNGTTRGGVADVGAYAYVASGNPGWALAPDFKDTTSAGAGGDGGANPSGGAAGLGGSGAGASGGSGALGGAGGSGGSSGSGAGPGDGGVSSGTDSDGCGCVVVSKRQPGLPFALALGAALGLLARRRRRG